MLPSTLTSFLLATLFITLTTATPITKRSKHPSNFLLVTTTSPTVNTNSSLLANVSATSLFDPYDQQAYLLRTIGPGYDSLPTFNLTHGTLHSLAYAPEATGQYVYNSTKVTSGGELQFLPSEESGGGLGLKGGYLLSVGRKAEGWTICDAPLGESIILWKGTDSSCVATYIQAVTSAPY